MTDASTSEDMSPGLRKVAERARKEPEGVFHSLAHLIDVPALERAYRRARKDAPHGSMDAEPLLMLMAWLGQPPPARGHRLPAGGEPNPP